MQMPHMGRWRQTHALWHPFRSSAVGGGQRRAGQVAGHATLSSDKALSKEPLDEEPVVGSSRFARLRNVFLRSSSKADPSLGPIYAQFNPKCHPRGWDEAVKASEDLVRNKGSVINPKELLGKDLSLIRENIARLLGSGHPVLNTISKYYFSKQGKHIRPLIVLLMAQATHGLRDTTSSLNDLSSAEIDQTLSRSPDAIRFQSPIEPQESPSNSILPSQRRLAEISEMIHTASLLHDDVIDKSMMRRSQPSANAEYGNKMAILAGDFLLARASLALARLRNPHVVELLATVISNLVEGEFMQLRNSPHRSWLGLLDKEKEWNDKFDYYMKKTYMKTASLIAKSCEASALLGGCSPQITAAAYEYGRNLGLAFQVVDDMLDFTVSEKDLGKPANADLKLGLSTAPVLYAAKTYPELYELIDRKFSKTGDIELV
jgi:hexaprenyl-diphosphate synthase